jgi:hypothetical protein
MADDNNPNNAQAHQQAPEPNLALKSLDKLVGTWKASDPSGAGAINGQTTFERMEGGHFLIQRVESESLKLHYFDNSGSILEYTYEVDDDTIAVLLDMPRAKRQFIGRFSDDGNTYTGGWEWTQDGVKMAYAATMTRAK